MGEPRVRGSPERRVLGELGNMKTEPVSPTANLRLLTTLASNLESASHSSGHSKHIRRNFNAAQDPDPDPLKLLPRKEKSLGLLCNKFLSLYPLSKPDDTPQEISLDSTAKALGTEKRRIYDIINVLESLEMASKAGKNRYLWHGQSGLCTTLARLKSLAIRLGLREQIQEIQRINKAYSGESYNGSPCQSATTVSQSPGLDCSFNDTGVKEDKSLGVMCQKFIMLFLISLKNGVINLDIAAKVLITDTDQSVEITDTSLRSRFKTKVRRLYDIANVLTAIGLIKKVSMCDSTIRKPVFKYTGPDVDNSDVDAETPFREGTRHSLIAMATPSRSMTRTFSPRFSSTRLVTTPSRLLTGNSCTPFTDRKEPRKRKLFGSDDKFGRTQSSPCLEIDRPLERLDDSILQVAEMELKRLKSNEEPKPKVCVKLFPRHNSDSCISATQVSGEFSNNLGELISQETNDNGNYNIGSFSFPSGKSNMEIMNDKSDVLANREPFMVVSKENLVRGNVYNATNTFQIANVNMPLQFNIANLQGQIPMVKLATVDSNVCNLQAQNDTNVKPLKLKVRDHNVPAEKTIAPKKLVVPTEKTIAPKKLVIRDPASDNKRMVKITPYRIQATTTTPKFVSLTNFDTKKLIPIKPSEFKVSVTPIQSVVVENPNVANTSYAILTQVQTPVLSPGDLFKAVKVGNTLQLVPICNQNSVNSNSENSVITNSS